MVVVTGIPDPLLEMCAQNDAGIPIASFNSELNGDYI